MVTKQERRKKIRFSIRKKINGTATKPRLSIYRSNKGIYCQLIDDVNNVTLASASSKDAKIAKGANKTEMATAVGTLIAEKAKSNNIEHVVFDRSGYLYHGRVKALAEAARNGGLNF